LKQWIILLIIFFNHPQYLYIDNQPVVILYQTFIHQGLLGFDSLEELVTDIRYAAQSLGYEIYLVGDVMKYVEEDWQYLKIESRIQLFDAISSYVVLDTGPGSNFSEHAQSTYKEMVDSYQNKFIDF
jgi:hypothetical protein